MCTESPVIKSGPHIQIEQYESSDDVSKHECEKIEVPIQKGSAFGGILCALGIMFIFSLFIQDVIPIIYYEKYKVEWERKHRPEHKLHEVNVTLGNFNSSLQFVFGFSHSNKSLNPLDNPYVDFIAYNLSTGE